MKWLRGVSLLRRLTLASILPVLLLGLLATLFSIYALQRTALDLASNPATYPLPSRWDSRSGGFGPSRREAPSRLISPSST